MPGIPKTTGTTAGRPQWAQGAVAPVDLAPDRGGLERDQEERFQDPHGAVAPVNLAPDRGLERDQKERFQDPDNVQ